MLKKKERKNSPRTSFESKAVYKLLSYQALMLITNQCTVTKSSLQPEKAKTKGGMKIEDEGMEDCAGTLQLSSV